MGYWSASPGLNLVQPLKLNLNSPPRIDLTTGLASKSLHYFAGRTSPIEMTGVSESRTGQVSFLVLTEDEMRLIRRMATLPAPHLFRMPDGTTVFASIGPVSDKRVQRGAYQITLNVTEVEQ